METYLCTLDDDFLDFCDSMEDYCDIRLDSPSSNFSDQENIDGSLIQTPRNCKNPLKRVQQRRAANMRERRRMRSINDAFDALRTCIPAQVSAERRLSKVDTLRLAIKYIGYLAEVLQTYDQCGDNNNNSQRNEKIILRCNSTDMNTQDGEGVCLLGHSLSWGDERTPITRGNNRLSAKIWVPEFANEADLASLSTLTSEYIIQ